MNVDVPSLLLLALLYLAGSSWEDVEGLFWKFSPLRLTDQDMEISHPKLKCIVTTQMKNFTRSYSQVKLAVVVMATPNSASQIL